MIEGIVFDLKFERDRRCYRPTASRPTIGPRHHAHDLGRRPSPGPARSGDAALIKGRRDGS